MADFLCFSGPGVPATQMRVQRSDEAAVSIPEEPPEGDPPDGGNLDTFFPAAPAAARSSRCFTESSGGTRPVTELFSREDITAETAASAACMSDDACTAADSCKPRLDKDSDLECPICEEVVYRPVRTRCHHAFCLACLTMWLKEAPIANCPLCRSSLEKFSTPNASSDRSSATSSTAPTPSDTSALSFTSGASAASSTASCAEQIPPESSVPGSLSLSAPLYLSAASSSSSPASVALDAASAASSSSRRPRPPYVYDPALEAQAIARLGLPAYHERELDTMEERLEQKMQAYREKLDKLSAGSSVAAMGLGFAGVTTATTVWGACTAAYVNTYFAAQAVGVSALASGAVGDGVGLLTAAHTYASTAFWSTVTSAELASSAATIGMVAGVSVAAFLGGMKLAAWLDDQGRYCLLRSPYKRSIARDEVGSPSIWILNLLGTDISAAIFAARRKKQSKRRSVTETIADFVATESGISSEEPKGRMYLEAEGEPLLKWCVQAKSECRIPIPPKATQQMLLTCTLEGLVVDSELGSCRLRAGQRFILCEFDDSAQEVLRGTATVDEKASAASSARDCDDSDEELPPPPPQWRRQRWEERFSSSRTSVCSQSRGRQSIIPKQSLNPGQGVSSPAPWRRTSRQ